MPAEVASADNASIYRVSRVGEWVRCYSQGIWRVNRVLQDFYEISDRRTTKREKSGRTLVFSKRLLNKSWKRSFSVEVCDITLTRPLEPEEKNDLNHFIAANPDVISDFTKYQRPLA